MSVELQRAALRPRATIGSLFTGTGAFELGLLRAGLGPVLYQVENDHFCQAHLQRRFPGVLRFDDVRTVGRHNLPRTTIICGGFPCQDLSVAGRGKGLAGDRSGLWYELARILEELAPPIALIENVSAGRSRWLPYVRRDLHLLGYRTRAFQVSAADVGGAALATTDLRCCRHLRRRATARARTAARWTAAPSTPAAARRASGLSRSGASSHTTRVARSTRDTWSG